MLFNDHLRMPGETIGKLVAEIRSLSQDDKVWYAQQFVAEGHTDSVTSKDATGQDIPLA